MNDVICNKIETVPIEYTMWDTRLRWFRHVRSERIDAIENVYNKIGREKQKKTW